jgi:hydroxymethylglutaryl-CoA lyase
MKIVEVGPRDGLQNETATVPTAAKVAFVDALSSSGVSEIEVSAFVSPRKVPQLGDAAEVFQRIRREDRVTYSALVPNQRGLDRALAAGVSKVSVFTAASETFNRRNINTSIAGSLKRLQPVVRRAVQAGIPVRGYLSTAFWCAFEGKIAPEAAVTVAESLISIGVDEVSISDTIGKATPTEVARLLDKLLLKIPADRIAVHFHDTYGRGVANALTSWEYGIRIFDASVGGIGGCPFAPGATGNVATEAVVAALVRKGVAVPVDIKKLSHASRILDAFLRDDQRSQPEKDSQACAVCEHFTGNGCCQQEAAS